jgi:ribosomal-protein-serine acetyltransferase
MTVARRELGDGLALRPFEERDADELFALIDRSRAHLAPWMPWLERHTTRADSLRFVRDARAHVACGGDVELAIVEDGRIVGVASLVAIDRTAGTCRCGYWLAPEQEGRGVMTRAMSSLLEHAFVDLGLREVALRAAPTNVRSRAVAERLGFRCVGPIDGGEQYGERWGDLVEYRLLAEEWREQGRAG